MDLLSKAKVVRLRSYHNKYLAAEDDESVVQERNGASRQAKWTVEFVGGNSKLIRLKSCHGRYLCASNKPYLLGLTGHKVIQDLPARLDSSVEWEPVRERKKIKLKTRYGNFLRANGGTYPYKNSITHDVPQRTVTQDWVLWDLEVIEVLPLAEPAPESPQQQPQRNSSGSRWETQPKFQGVRPISPSPSPPRSTRYPSTWASIEDIESMLPRTPTSSATSSPNLTPTLSNKETFPCKPNGRIINYHIADDEGNVDDSYEGSTIHFEGTTLQELTERLEDEIRMDGVIICTHNVLTDKLSPLRLHLPPNNATMNVVIVASSSKVAERFAGQGLI